MQSLVHVHAARGDETMALSVAREAVAVFRELGNKSLEASMLTEVAKLHSMGGQLEEARRVADEAALLYRDTGDFVGQAGAMRIMGAVEDAKVTQAKRFEEEAESQALLTKLRDAVVERDAVVFKATLQEIYDNPYVNLDMAQELLQPLVDKDPDGVGKFYEENQPKKPIDVNWEGTDDGPDYAGTQLERQTTYFWMRVGMMGYGPGFRLLRTLFRKGQLKKGANCQGLGVLYIKDDFDDWEERSGFHPGILDCALQSQSARHYPMPHTSEVDADFSFAGAAAAGAAMAAAVRGQP